VKTTRTILLAAFLILAALFFAGAAQPQALIVDTAGQTVGDGSHTVAPIDVDQANGDTQAAASAGHGTGSAARADAQNGDDGVTAIVGCIDASASSGDLGASAGLGNCDGGSTVGRGAGAGVEDGATGGGLDLGCLNVALDGTPSAGLQLGACEGSAGGGDNDGGDDGSGNDDNGDNGAGGVLDEQAGGVLGASGSAGDQGGDGSNNEPCGTFDQASALASPGSLSTWLLALVALGGVGLGSFLTRRRARRSEPLS
jgi:hypothetical protein